MMELELIIVILFFVWMYMRGEELNKKYLKQFGKLCSMCGELSIPIYGEYNTQAKEHLYLCADCGIKKIREEEKHG